MDDAAIRMRACVAFFAALLVVMATAAPVRGGEVRTLWYLSDDPDGAKGEWRQAVADDVPEPGFVPMPPQRCSSMHFRDPDPAIFSIDYGFDGWNFSLRLAQPPPKAGVMTFVVGKSNLNASGWSAYQRDVIYLNGSAAYEGVTQPVRDEVFVLEQGEHLVFRVEVCLRGVGVQAMLATGRSDVNVGAPHPQGLLPVPEPPVGVLVGAGALALVAVALVRGATVVSRGRRNR